MKSVLSFAGMLSLVAGLLLFAVTTLGAVFTDGPIGWAALLVGIGYGLSGFFAWALFGGVAEGLERLERLERLEAKR